MTKTPIPKYNLIKWDKITKAIAEAKDIDQLKILSDKLEAIRILAKQSKQSLKTQNNIAEYRLRVERKKGEWLKENIEQGGDRKSKKSNSTYVSLKNMGITWNESSQAQRISNIPQKTFEKLIKEIKEEQKELTKTFMVNIAKKIQRATDIQEQKEAIEKGEITLPKGQFEVIVVDPPWDYGTNKSYDPKSFRGSANYPVMSILEIKSIQLPTAKDCILWLWTTHKFMRYSFEILDHWGFEDKTILTWVKDRIGIGKWLRSKSEYCIMAVKGKPIINLTNQTTVLEAKNKGHSVKPDEFYKMVDELCIGRKLDYFARKKREGWDVYGVIQ